MQNNTTSFFIGLILVNLHKVTIKPLAGKLEFHFSYTFHGIIWNMILVPGRSILVLEVRDEEKRQVSFSASDFNQNQFLWKDVRVSEPWWVNLFMADDREILLSKFENTNNPDSVSYLRLDLQTASVRVDQPGELRAGGHVNEIIVPVQYLQESMHFETVKKFIYQKLHLTSVHAIEYLENSGMIFISLYTQNGTDLENHLLIFDEGGELVFGEKIGTGLKGLGLETFFIRDGFLFFVKNKAELVVYRVR